MVSRAAAAAAASGDPSGAESSSSSSSSSEPLVDGCAAVLHPPHEEMMPRSLRGEEEEFDSADQICLLSGWRASPPRCLRFLILSTFSAAVIITSSHSYGGSILEPQTRAAGGATMLAAAGPHATPRTIKTLELLGEEENDDDDSAAAAATRRRVRLITHGNCFEVGMYPILNQLNCELAAQALGLQDIVADVTTEAERPQGCYYSRGIRSGHLWMGAGPNWTGAVFGWSLSREPICSMDLPSHWTSTTTRTSTSTLFGTMMGSVPLAATNGQDATATALKQRKEVDPLRKGHDGCPICAPRKPIVPDVVISLFERDLCKAKLAAEALSTNDPEKVLGNVYLLWVSPVPTSDYKDELIEIAKSISKTRKVHLIDFSKQLVYARSKDKGVQAQQILKLKVASIISSEFYLALDAKNALIKPLPRSSLFTEPCNLGKIQAELFASDLPYPYSQRYELAAQALGLDLPSDGKLPIPAAPFLLHKQTVLKMLISLGENPSPHVLCSGPLCDLISPDHEATEFAMYSLFALSSSSSSSPSSSSSQREEEEEEGNLHCAHSLEEKEESLGRFLWYGDGAAAAQANEANMGTLDRAMSNGGQQGGPFFLGVMPKALSTMAMQQQQDAAQKLKQIFGAANLAVEDKSLRCLTGSTD